jgi:hypothetical protein
MATPPNPGRTDADDPTVATVAEATTTAPTPTSVPVRERWRRGVAQFRRPDVAGSVVEPVSPHVAPPDPVLVADAVPATGRPRWRASVQVAMATAVGLAGALVVAGTAPEWHLVDHSWRLTVPGLLSPGDPLYSAITFVGGVLLMCLGWVGLVGHMRRGTGSNRTRVLWVLAATALWSLPLLLGPIQLSTDAYSYGAQGLLADLGHDPTTVGPDALPNHSTNDFWKAADPTWRDAAAPYGPVAIGLARATVVVTDYDVAHAALGFRGLALVGVALTGVGVYLIARSRRVSAPLALALAIANPVVVVHLIGGAHNDALMMGLLAVGLAAFERSRKVLAVLLIALAIGVKLPAVIALAFIAWNWTAPDAPWKRRIRDFAVVGAITAGTLAVLSVLVGIGIGWILALQNTGKVYSTFAVFTKIGFLVSDLLNAVGLDVDPMPVVAVVRLIGLLTAAALILVLMVKSPKIGVSKAVGVALLVFVLCSPVVWPWYLPAAFALIAASGTTAPALSKSGRVRSYRPSFIVLVVSASLLVWPTSVNSVSSLTPYQHWLGFGVAVLIAVACVAAQYLSSRVERYRFVRGHRPLLTGAADEMPPRVVETAVEPVLATAG